jgi:putative tricarboxylic transport membrane protein
MLGFGLIGYILRKLQFDPGPMLLAFILGPMIERSLRQSLILSGGSFAIFAQRPISAMLLGVVVGLIVLQIVLNTRRREKKA